LAQKPHGQPDAGKSMLAARLVEAACAYAGLRPQQAVDCANARLQPDQLAEVMICDDDATLLLQTAIEQSRLSARAYHKV
jgi:predicted ATPase with chaperone activity